MNTAPRETKPPAEQTEVERQAFDMGKTAARNRWLLIIIGGFSLLAGLLAIAMPFVGSLAAALIAGWVLVISGLIGLVAAFRRNHGWQMAAVFALALVTFLAGMLVLLQPLAGIFALTTLIIAYFGATGAMRIYLGVRNFGEGGGWMVALGALSAVLALLLWFGLPYNIIWVPGVLLGVDLLFWGALTIAFAARVGRPSPLQDSGV